MERFLMINVGMTIEQVEELLNEKFVIERQREEHFKSDIVHFDDAGVWLFFKPDTGILYTIRYESPFCLEIDGVKIGDAKKDVKHKKGVAPRINPPPHHPGENTIWIYGESGEDNWVRYDFEKTRNGKCITIYK